MAFMLVCLLAAGLLQFSVVTPSVVLAQASNVTYYFDAYGAAYWDSFPGNMIDGLLTTYASTSTNNKIQLNNSNTCPGTDLGTISKVELQVYGYGDGNDKISLQPVFTGVDGPPTEWMPGTDPAWSGYFDITNDTNAPSPWTWTDVQNLDVNVQYLKAAQGQPMQIAKVEIRITYTPTGIEKSGSQGITISDGVTTSVGVGRNVSHGITIADGVTASAGRSRNISQGITMSDGVTTAVGRERDISQPLSP